MPKGKSGGTELASTVQTVLDEKYKLIGDDEVTNRRFGCAESDA